MNGVAIEDGRIYETKVDTGSTGLFGPEQAVEKIYKTIGAVPSESEDGLYEFPCTVEVPTLSFNWGGQDWDLAPEDWILEHIKEEPLGKRSQTCIGTLVAAFEDAWVLGSPFWKSQYLILNHDTNEVGIGRLRREPRKGQRQGSSRNG